MAASKQPVGMDHPTVIPENFDPEKGECPTCGESPDES